ncbi:hypothetical protein EPC71_07560, partial [Helicobacter pylori]
PPKNANEIVQILLENALKEIFDTVKKLKELYSKIIEKLFGDENAKKDHQDILNAITELKERPTKQELQAKDNEINTLKQDKTTLTNQLQEQATETKKAQDRIKTLESNETTLKNDLNAKESTIQAKDKTISELKKQIQDLEHKYKEDREQMIAENKRLQEQGLDKIYTQKDYEALKAEHNKQVEALKKKLKEQDQYKMQAQQARYRYAKQRNAMRTKQTTTPTPSTPQPTHTYTKRM